MASTISRREFLAASAAAWPAIRTWQLPVDRPVRASARLAVIADLHHGLAPDALTRFDAFLGAVRARAGLDAVWQLGDFCYGDPGAAECLARWREVRLPRHNVLGNHDMDKVDKAGAMAATGMAARYGATVIGGWRFVVLDLNHFRKDGVLQLIAAAGRANPRGRVACCMSGHLHIDRVEAPGGLPCLSVNSASYFWSGGMHPYTQPLYAFMEFSADGVLRVEGRHGEFVAPPPKDSDAVIGRSASLSDRTIRIGG